MRIAQLDGLRAIAILAVLLHHYDYVRGGWVGVDLFFVLSGFLITGILRRERTRPGYWKRFYLKRATRILPPLLLLIALVAVRDHPPVRQLAAYLLFMGNFASTRPEWVIPNLILIWSLAVEEHFYLVFPFAVRFLSRTILIRMLAMLVALEPVARWIVTSHVHSYLIVYFWTIFRLDSLAMGALLALAMEDDEAKIWIKHWSGLSAILAGGVFGVLSLLDRTRFDREANSQLFNSLGYSLLAIASVAVIAYVLLHAESWPSRILKNRALVFLGVISYGLYLYHQLVRVTLAGLTGWNNHRLFPLGLAAAVLVSWMSFRWLEKPMIGWGHRAASRVSNAGDSAQLGN